MHEVDELAEVIRRVDGGHQLGAAALAEAILGEGYALVKLPAAPSDVDRARRAHDLTSRVRLVQARGWGPFRWTWSSGEVAGVALVLQDGALVDEVKGTETEALDTWAATLWGISGGTADAEAGHPRTREWFANVRTTTSGAPLSEVLDPIRPRVPVQ